MLSWLIVALAILLAFRPLLAAMIYLLEKLYGVFVQGNTHS